MAEEYDIPVFVITGFLESGKTSFIRDTVAADYFQMDAPTLLITCEEVEEEYDKATLLNHNTLLEVVAEKEDFTPQLLKEFQRKYQPERVIIEYNPLWGLNDLWDMEMPRRWGILQQIVTVDASTFQVYLSNMKSIFMDMCTRADMVVFNRANAYLPLANFRRSIKVVNPAVDIIFENEAREPMDIFEDSLPYETDTDLIQIDDVDYGIFYVDMRDCPERYQGKTVQFKAVVLKSKNAEPNVFVPGRKAMTCCAEDIRYIGFVCKTDKLDEWKAGTWIELTAEVSFGYSKAYRGEGPILTAKKIVACDPPATEIVFFN